MVAGHWKMASQSLNSVILSQSMAIKIFGNAESAIGKHMTLMRRLNTSPESTPKNRRYRLHHSSSNERYPSEQ